MECFNGRICVIRLTINVLQSVRAPAALKNVVELCYSYQEIYMELRLHWTVSASAKREHPTSLLSSREAVAVYIDRTRGVRFYFYQTFRGIRTGFHPLLMIQARANRNVWNCTSWYTLFLITCIVF
jgi:hypothetical protein